MPNRRTRRKDRQKEIENKNEVNVNKNDANISDTVDAAKLNKNVVENTDNERKVQLKRNKELEERKQQIITVLNSYGEKDAYLNIERRVLSSMFYLNTTASDRAKYQAAINTGIVALDFYSAIDGAIFEIAQELYNDKVDQFREVEIEEPVIDISIIDARINELANEKADLKEEYNNLGGLRYLADIVKMTINSLSMPDYATKLKQYSDKKKLIDRTIDFANNIDLSDKAKSESNFTDLIRLFNTVTEDKEDKGLLQLKSIISEWINKVQNLMNLETENDGISLGNYHNLNDILGGVRRGQMITIGARPGVGKTAFALNLASQIMNNKKTQTMSDAEKPVVAMFSLEMNNEEILERFASMKTKMPVQKIRKGELTDDEFANLVVFSNKFTDRFYIDDEPNKTVNKIEQDLENLKEERGHIELVIIDYLQLITGAGGNRQQEVSDISRSVKKIAKHLQVPVVTLVQLSRSLEQRQDKRPILSDIRESGSIEQDSDIVMFLYRDDYYSDAEEVEQQAEEDESDDSLSKIELIVEKNRSGTRGTIDFAFQKGYSLFSESDFSVENLSNYGSSEDTNQSHLNSMKDRY